MRFDRGDAAQTSAMERSLLSCTFRLLTSLVALTLIAQHVAHAQATPQSEQTVGIQKSQDGMANAGPHTAEFDSNTVPSQQAAL